MKERPILMNGEMVRATLDGRKTVTRRVVRLGKGKPMPPHGDPNFGPGTEYRIPCPYGQPGDRLWVRETWHPWAIHNGEEMVEATPRYRADFQERYGAWERDFPPNIERIETSWKPSIHMPRWASRITLEVTGVRVERVQDITEAQAVAEGMLNPYPDSHPTGHLPTLYRTEFRELWDSLNAKRGFGWDKNPHVWVVEFRKVPA